MATKGGRIEYSVGFKADAASLNNIKNSLSELKKISLEALNPSAANYDSHERALINLRESVGQLEGAFDKAFNKDLGTLNIAKFNKELQKLNLHKIEKDMQAAGAAGQTAFRNIAAQALTTNMQLKQTHTFVDKIATTLSNTIKWNLASSAVNSFTGQVQQAYGYVKNLDSSLNDIRIVTGKATEEMAEFAKLANKTAQDLGKGTVDYTNAALIYYQQGLEESEVQARAEVTLKAANVTGQSASEVSEQLTAVWNGYKVNSQEAELYVDKLAAVAATTASDLEELSTGMSKVASAANTMGVDIDQLNAQLATIVSITRQAPESVGTALKTIYARMGDIEAGLDEETTLGNYTQAMADMGFNVLDMNGNLRDMGEVIEEIGNKWTTLSREQQVALSQTVAGTRQYNNLLALFDNWDMYTEALETSADAAGTLQKQQDIYMESTAAHLEKLDAKWEDFYDSILDNNTINKAADLLGGLVDGLTNVVDGLGGGIQTFKLLGTVATSILSKKIAGGISTFIKNIDSAKNNVAQFKAQLNTVEIFKGADDAVIRQMADMRNEAIKYSAIMDAERQNEATAHIQTINRLNQQQAEWEESKKKAAEYYKSLTGTDQDIANESLTKKASEGSQEQIQGDIKSWRKELQNADKNIEDTEKILNKLSSGLLNFDKNINASEDELNNIIKTLDDAKGSLDQLDTFIIDTINSGKQLPEELGEAFSTYQSFIKDGTGIDLENNQAKSAAMNYIAALKKAMPQMEAELKNFESFCKQAWNGVGEAISEELKEAETSWNKFIKVLKTEDGINTVINLTNSFVQLYQLFQSFKNLGNIWSDESLTQNEKMEQTIGNLITIIPLALSSINTLKTSAINLATSMNVANASTMGLGRAMIFLMTKTPVGPILAVVGAIAALVTIYDKLNISAKEAANELNETRKAFQESSEELKNLETELDNVKTRLEELLALDNPTFTDKEEIKNLQLEQALLESKLKTQKAINEAKKQEYTDKITQNREAGNYEVKEFVLPTKTKQEYVQSSTNPIGQDLIETEISYLEDFQNTEFWGKNRSENNEQFYNKIEELLKNVDTLDLTDPQTYEKIKNEYDNLLKQVNTLNGGNMVSRTAKGALEKYIGEILTSYEEARKNALEVDIDALLMDLEQSGTEENRKSIQNKIASSYRVSGAAYTNINNAFQNFTQERVAELETAQDVETLKNLLSPEELQSLTGYADTFGIGIDNLLQDFISYEITINSLSTEAEKNLASLEKQIESLKEKAKQTGELAEALKSEKELTEEQITYLQQLEKEYEGLNNILDKNSEKYIDALYQVQELQEEEATALANQKVAEIAEKIEVDMDATEFYNAMDELVNAEYEALITIKTDTKSDFDNVVSQMEDMSDLIGKIGEGFVVSAEDVSELTSVFPELLQGITYLEDGTVQLNKTSVEQAQKTAKAKIKLSTDEAIIEIEAQNKVLMAEKERYAKALEILQQAEKDGLTIKELSASDQFIVENALTKAQITNAEDVAEAKSLYAAQEQETFVKNNEEVLYETGKAVEEWAEKFNANVKYAYTGEETEGIDRTFIKKKESTPIVSPLEVDSHPIILNPIASANFDKFLNSSKPKNLEKQKENIALLDSLVQSYDDAIDLNNSYIAELLARQNEQLILFDNIGAGYGADGNNADILELLSDEYDRYHDINIIIEKITDSLSDLEKQQKKLTGKDLTNNLQAQLNILERQKKAYEDKLKIAKAEQKELQNNLTDYGATFDAAGNLTNYSVLYAQQLKNVLDVQKQYNEMSEAEQENYKATVDAAEKKFETFEELLSKYDDVSYNTITELENNIQDSIDSMITKQIELFTFDINFKIDSTEFKRDFKEFKKDIIDELSEDDILGNALFNLDNLKTTYYENGYIQQLTKQLTDTAEQIQQIKDTGTSSVYGDNEAQAYEDLKKYYEELQDELQGVKDTVDSIAESYLDMIDEAKEKFDDHIAQYEYVADLINSDMNIIKLLYGEDSYEELEKFYNALEENNNKQVDFYRQQVEFWRQRMDAEEEGSEAWEKYRDNWQDAVANLNSTVESSIETLVEKYQNTVSKIFKDLNEKLTGGRGLGYINEEWELINENADQYLDKVNASFEIQKLQNKYLDAIDSADSVGVQNRLNDLMNEQLKMLREKDKLTQYDVDRANALYDIALKEIALQDAQQAKTKMRLRRDSQGNYTYQYIADGDAVSQAQQELDEAKNSVYNMDKDEYRDNLDAIYGYYEEFQNKVNELYSDATISDEEREAKRLLYVEQYNDLIQGKLNENEIIRANLQTSAQEAMSESFNALMMEDLIPQWDSGVQHMVESFAGEGGFIPSCSGAMGDLNAITEEYKDSLTLLEEVAGMKFEGIAAGYNTNIDLAKDLLVANSDLITQYTDEINAIKKVQDELDILTSKYAKAKEEAIAATEAAYKYWQSQNEDTPIETNAPNTSIGSTVIGSGQDTVQLDIYNKLNNKYQEVGREVSTLEQTVSRLEEDIWHLQQELIAANAKIAALQSDTSSVITPPNTVNKPSLGGGNKNFTYAAMFDTGGYTGEWSNSGKLGILHEKELVLNQTDTSNILSAVTIARTISNIVNAASNRIAGMASGFSSQSGLSGALTASGTQQNITIHADFPNATDHSEIEEAFNNLLNTASQYSFRNERG